MNESFNDRLKFELGKLMLDKTILEYQLDDAKKRIEELEQTIKTPPLSNEFKENNP